jgi:hypothetical protein
MIRYELIIYDSDSLKCPVTESSEKMLKRKFSLSNANGASKSAEYQFPANPLFTVCPGVVLGRTRT